MNRLLCDTTFMIDAEREVGDVDEMIGDTDDVAIAAITIAELRVGALLAGHRRAAARAAYVDAIMAAVPVIHYDVEVAEAHASLLAEVKRQGRPRGAHDLIIAATARASGRIVLTADRKAFVDLDGVEVRPHR